MEKLFCVSIYRKLFRAGEPAEIIGAKMVVFKKCPPRICFKIRFNDGVEDFIPVFSASDSAKKNPLYAIITEADVRAGRIPKAIN
jgi:hypothetical protein